MASPSSGTCSGGSSSLQSYDHDETGVLLMEQRKRKRMISNRESARRSRMRKQKHLDDLMAQLTQLRSDNHQIVTNINVVDHLLLNVESENSVLRVQFSELNNRLQALGDIITFMNAKNTTTERDYGDNINNYDQMTAGADDFFNPWNSFHGVNQPMIGCNIDAFMC